MRSEVRNEAKQKSDESSCFCGVGMVDDQKKVTEKNGEN